MKYLKTYEGMYYSNDMKKTINDILLELRDDGFKYFFNDIREGLTITLEKGYYDTFKKSDIVDPFLMLEDYMREEWGNDIRISYEYSEVKEVVSTFIEYIEEIWGVVNVKWRCYGYPDPNEVMQPKSFNTEPDDNKYLYDVEIQLKNHN